MTDSQRTYSCGLGWLRLILQLPGNKKLRSFSNGIFNSIQTYTLVSNTRQKCYPEFRSLRRSRFFSFRYFKKGKTINGPTAAVRKRYCSTSHRYSRSNMSVLDLSISRTETLLGSTKTKRVMACFLQMEITEFEANVVFVHVPKYMAGQDGERNVCGTNDGRSGDFNSLKGRLVPCFRGNDAFTHLSPPQSLFCKIPKHDFSPKMCVQVVVAI